MKLNMELDCTPQEARELLGLPDIRPMQSAVMGRVEKQMLDAAELLSPEGLLRTWLSLVPIGSEQYRRTLGGLFRKAASAPDKT